MRPTVAVIGGGFTGAAVAFHLAQAQVAADILVFEPRPRLGAGLAYGDEDPAHRINVPASRMSLLPDDESQFARWLDASGALASDPAARAGAEAFPARAVFGRYVAEHLAPHVHSGAVRHVRDEVAALMRDGRGWRLVMRRGESFRADIAAIATTHPPPGLPRELAALADHPRLIADGLRSGALAEIGRDERLLIVGAGLTAADLVATLDGQGHRGRITMIARRGLRARGHASAAHPAEGDFANAPSARASDLLARVRKTVRASVAAGRGWHCVLDAVRVQGQAIWAALDPSARRRIVRHLRPYWDVHRFRVAPQIEALLDAGLASGSLELRKARLRGVRADVGGFDVDLGGGFERFDRIALATGPAHGDIFRTQAYLRELREAGAVAPDDVGLGLKTSRSGRAVGADGRADPCLFIAGPLARGTLGELMGLPQVSSYAHFIAAQIADALHSPADPHDAGRPLSAS